LVRGKPVSSMSDSAICHQLRKMRGLQLDG